jgi:hypothetical protein
MFNMPGKKGCQGRPKHVHLCDERATKRLFIAGSVNPGWYRFCDKCRKEFVPGLVWLGAEIKAEEDDQC